MPHFLWSSSTSRSVSSRLAQFVAGLVVLGLLPDVAAQHRIQPVGKRHLPQFVPWGFGSAVAPGDVDGDGDLDLVFAIERVTGPQLSVLLNDGRGVFAPDPANELSLGIGTPNLVRCVDLDGDGDLDVILGLTPWDAPGSGVDRVFENVGPGRFVERAAVLPSVDAWTWALEVADVDADGSVDLFVGYLDHPGDLWLQTAPWVFTPAAAMPWVGVLDDTRAAAFADVDRDGDPDLLQAGIVGSGSGLRVWENQGGGRFVDATAEWLPGGLGDVYRMLVADLDGDGDPDLLVETSSRQLLWNHGGQLIPLVGRIPPAAGVGRMLVADMDGDGPLDLCDALTGVFLQRQIASFGSGPGLRFPRTNRHASDFVHGDFDGDGDQDLVRTWFGSQDHQLLLNDGEGNLDAAVTSTFGSPDARCDSFGVVDVNDDGYEDVVLHDGVSLRVLQNDRFGDFVDATSSALRLHTDIAEVRGLFLVFDANGDGRDDVFVGRLPPSSLGVTRWHYLLQSDGFGVLDDVSLHAFPDPGAPIRSAVHGDVDGDGDQDLVVGRHGRDSLHLLLNDGRGRFVAAPAGSLPRWNESVLALGCADLDGDGALDLVVADGSYEGAAVFINDSTGRFHEASAQWLASAPRLQPLSVAMEDVDGDGRCDVLFGEIQGTGPTASARLFLNPGGGAGLVDVTASHLPPPFPTLYRTVEAIECVDLDADGDLDFVLGCGQGWNWQYQEDVVLENDGTGHFSDASAVWLRPEGRVTPALAARDFDRDGDLDLFRSRRDEFGPTIQLALDTRFHLQVPWLVQIGRTLRYEVVAPPGTMVRVAASLGEIDQELPGLGRLRIDPSSAEEMAIQTVAAGADRAVLEIPVPADPALVGLLLYSQGLCIQAGSARLTNPTRDVVGR